MWFLARFRYFSLNSVLSRVLQAMSRVSGGLILATVMSNQTKRSAAADQLE